MRAGWTMNQISALQDRHSRDVLWILRSYLWPRFQAPHKPMSVFPCFVFTLTWSMPASLPSPSPPFIFFLLWFLREGLHILLCIQWLGTHWILQARPTWEYSISLCSAGISGTLHLVPASWHHCHSTPCCRFWYQEGFDIKTLGNQLQVSHSYQDHTP